MRKHFGLGILYLAAAPFCWGLTSDLRADFEKANFTLVNRIEDFPQSVRELISETLQGGVLANPTERFQSTDDITEPKLPPRRLVLGGVSEDMVFVLYEHGGIAYHQHLLIYKRDTNSKFHLAANIGLTWRDLPKDIQSLKTAFLKTPINSAKDF